MSQHYPKPEDVSVPEDGGRPVTDKVQMLSMDEIVESLYNFSHKELIGLANECLLIVVDTEEDKDS